MSTEIAMAIPMWDEMPPALSWKDKVCLLSFALTLGRPGTSTLTERFEEGMYIRRMGLPAGSFITGREHVRGHLMRLILGAVILIAPDGRFVFKAPAELMTKPGFQAVAFAISDIVVETLHPNPDGETDMAKIENEWFGSGIPDLARGHELALKWMPHLLEAA